MARSIFLALALLLSLSLQSQSVYVPQNADYYWLIDRYEIKLGNKKPNLYTTSKPILRKDVGALTDSMIQIPNSSKSDQFNLNYLRNDNWDLFNDTLNVGLSNKRLSKTFYGHYNAIYSYQSKDFTLIANPVVNFEQNTINKDALYSLNTRGIELRGMIGKKIGFYTFVTDNQAYVPDYVRETTDSVGAFPNEGFSKPFRTKGYDFFSARGYITFNIVKPIAVQFGHDKNFIGNGYRSLMLSDYSSKYLFLKFNTKIWRFNYTNIFAEMTAKVINGNNYNPRKYMAMHHLDFKLAKNFNIGVFEAIVFNRSDSATGNSGFELNYLNPVIFYREIESFLGGRDKVQIGADFKWNFANRFSLYGQIVINEFLFKNIVAQNGWWGNKYAWQIGLKYVDVFGVKNLDLQLEHNFVRPYMYTDKNPLTNLSNYGQPLAHPLGANFYEFIGIVRYQPLPRLNISAKAFYITQGRDPAGLNLGSNINKPGYTPENQFNNEVGQGIRTNILFANLTVSYQLFHNFYIDVKQTIRRENSSISNESLIFTTGGIRWNIGQRLQEF
ncbi:MAG: hypothetical protein ACKVOU_14960 [Cytophagales bacterium]